nr:SIR2 family protein [Streptomyces canus]
MAFNTSQLAYQHFRSIVSERTSPLLVWTGAGVSADASLPTWSQLKEELLKLLLEKYAAYDAEYRNRMIDQVREIREEGNPWVAFQRIKKAMGATTWRSSIVRLLTPKNANFLPQAYAQIWELPIRGIMNLNLDRLATQAFTKKNPGAAPSEFAGRQAARLTYMLHSDRPFIANLHGDIDDAETWVLTYDEIGRLRHNKAYTEFLHTCLSSWANLFVGMTLDDVSVGSHLEVLAKRKVQGGPNFWLTNRLDSETDRWAEESGVEIIGYHAENGNHGEVLEFLQDLQSYIAPEGEAYPPVVSETYPEEADVPSPEDLSKRSAEEVREILNAHALKLLEGARKDDLSEYDNFIREYDEEIHHAWYLSILPNKNQLLGHTLHEQVAKGAFGKVFRATSPAGEEEAVKVLLEDIRQDQDRLQAFRRGVRSMQILQKNSVEGMVSYRDASEIPAFVSMEWIQGPDLKVAKNAHQLTDWDAILRVAKDLAGIIRSAHQLPERVLHRDIRPTNVMLRNFWVDPMDWRVVVLDFDLSWYRGASDHSLLESASGYLAPEQIIRTPGVTTRSGAVDSFGLGMTLYFLCSGRDPTPGDHLSEDWPKRLYQAASQIPGTPWKSLPNRFARCILRATLREQASRLDVPAIYGELLRLWKAHLDPSEVGDSELLAEEIAARCASMQPYEWESDFSRAVHLSPTGVTLQLEGRESEGKILLHVHWVDTGVHEKGGLAKYIKEQGGNVVADLQKGGWRKVEYASDYASIYISLEVGAEEARKELDSLSRSIGGAAERLQF